MTTGAVTRYLVEHSGDIGFDDSGNLVLPGTTNVILANRSLGPYLGFIANRGKTPDTTGGGNLQSMSRTRHVAMDTINSIQLAYVAYLASGGGETPSANPVNYTASVEYPIGSTPTQLTFSGQRTGVCSAGGTIFSDLVKLPVVIPRGANFYVRTYQTISAGGIFYSVSTSLNYPNNSAPLSGEWFVTAPSGVVDRTSDATNTNTTIAGSVGNVFPAAILGYTVRPSLLLCGDSRIVGGSTHELYPNSVGLSGELARNIGRRFGYCNVGDSSETMQQAAASQFTRRLLLAPYASHVVISYGINDFIAGRTAAQVLADLQTFIAKLGSKPTFVATVSPNSTSTDGWGTVANQTPVASNSARASYNDTLRRGTLLNVSGVIDIASVSESTPGAGTWRASERSAADCSINSGAAVLTSTATAQFTPDDVGKKVSVVGAGAAAAALVSTIITYTNATTVTLGNNASTAVGPTATTYIGTPTDDGLHAATSVAALIENSNAFAPLGVLA